MADTFPMQASGEASKGTDAPDGVNNQASVGQAGEGGNYPNPHTGKTERGTGGKHSTVMGHGGQTEIHYSGPGALGSRETGGDEANATTKNE